MPTLAYEYSSSKNNNPIMFGTSLLTAAPPLETGVLPAVIFTNQAASITLQGNATSLTEHGNKYTTVHGVTAIDILTGSVTYSAYEGSGYGNTHTVTGVPIDTVVDAMSDPYRVAGRGVVFTPLAPTGFNYSTAH